MKIVYNIAGTYNSGGMERVLSNKANWLVEKGHEVVIDARFVNIQKQHAVEQLKKILGVKN